MSVATTYRVLGIPMQQRRKRRQLVIITYASLGLITAATIAVATRYPLLYGYSMYAALAVGMFIFGGQGQRGLLKGFTNKPPRMDAPQSELIRLDLEPQARLNTADVSWRNDERELHRRDLAHYHAYQPVSMGVIVLVMLSALALSPKPWIPLAVVHLLSFSVAEITAILAVTLPAAIILWTEPDIDAT